MGNPLCRGVKRNRASKIKRCHVRVSHLLMSFLFNFSTLFIFRVANFLSFDYHAHGLSAVAELLVSSMSDNAGTCWVTMR